jgi:hypothetical protein
MKKRDAVLITVFRSPASRLPARHKMLILLAFFMLSYVSRASFV